MNNRELAHRWVHGMLNTHGELNTTNMHADNVNLRSYRTVIAQCLDRTRNVFIVIDECLTPSTAKHLSHLHGALHDRCLVIKTHFSESGAYDHVKLLGIGETFDRHKRLELVGHLLSRIYSSYENVKTGKKLSTENIDKRHLTEIFTLGRIYGGNLVTDWIKHSLSLPNANEEGTKDLRKMARMLLDEKSDKEITDALFGAGTWDAMQKRIAPLKKARNSRKVNEFLEHQRRLDAEKRYREMSYEDIFKAWRNFDTKIPYNILSEAIASTGGNVILRFSKSGDYIETSKGIRMTIDEALRCWQIVKLWEERQTFTEGMKFAGYNVNSYENGILKAGCHTVAFHEMMRMHDEIIGRQTA